MIGLIVSGLLASAAPVSTPPQVTASSKDFGAWQMRCETRKSGPESQTICGLVSSITVKNSDGTPTVATVIMVRQVAGADAGNYQLSMELPLSVWLPSGVILRGAEQQELMRLPFVSCHPQGCQAGSIIGPDLMAKLTASGNSAAATYELQIRKTVTLTFSMNGFNDALKALANKNVGAAS